MASFKKFGSNLGSLPKKETPRSNANGITPPGNIALSTTATFTYVQTNNRDKFLSTDFGLKEFNVKSEKERIRRYRR